MKTRQLMIVEPGKIELQEMELDEKLNPNQALVKAEYSIVIAGTEGAGFTGLIKEMPFQETKAQYPCATGYGHLGSTTQFVGQQFWISYDLPSAE